MVVSFISTVREDMLQNRKYRDKAVSERLIKILGRKEIRYCKIATVVERENS